jgi:DNA adenine methylase
MKTSNTTKAKPFIKWVGGKGKMLEQYERFFPNKYDRYFEPFLGGGSVFFHIEPDRAVLSDINKDLIFAYLAVRDNPDLLMELLDKHLANHDADYFKNTRRTHYRTDIEKAAKFVYLNKTCFNGLYRENKKGELNSPLNKDFNGNLYNRQNIEYCSTALQDVDIRCCAFGEALLSVRRGDFVYLDPPYDPVSKTSNFVSYSADGFDSINQKTLRDAVICLSDMGVKVMLSNSDTPLIRELYKRFSIHEVKSPRSVNSVGTKRGKISELLITNY